MFIGHYGLAYLAKKKAQEIPLYLLFISVQLLDLLAYFFIFLGIERANFEPNINPFFRNNLDLPYSHSLLGSIIISTVVFLIFWFKKSKKWAIILGLGVLSHWILDLIVHTPDLPILFGGVKVGLGLWEYPNLSFIVEVILLFAGWIIIKEKNAISYIMFILMIASFAGIIYADEPDIIKTNFYLRTSIVLSANILFVFLAYVNDRKLKQRI